MARPKGLAKTGGRKKGSLNKRTEELLGLAESFNYNPFCKIMEKYSTLPEAEQIKIDIKMLDYIYPKVKDHSSDIERAEREEAANTEKLQSHYEQFFSDLYSSNRDLGKTVDRILAANKEGMLEILRSRIPEAFLK